MKTSGNDRTLESFKIFPYVAWALIIGFAYFVYNITMELKAVTEGLQAQTQFVQEQMQIPSQDIENFERKNLNQ